MPKLVWDEIGKRLFETGVDQGVLYLMKDDGTYEEGVAWNGLTQVSENPSGGEANPLYADNIKYLNLYSAEEFSATIEAYTYPDEFAACDGSVAIATGVYATQQPRKSFGMCYRTKIGNDVVGDELGYKIHIIYGAKASPSEKAYSTVNDSPEAITFSWEVSTTPVAVAGHKPTSHLIIDSTKFTGESSSKLTALLNRLYGTDGGSGSAPSLPTPAEVLSIVSGNQATA